MTNSTIYQDIATRTAGDIYIGVVGPVRTGKSTFIKSFMEQLVLPGMEDVYQRERARDELPQSGSGRTIMTAEPKFVPEEAAHITLEDGAGFDLRLIDCVGYLVEGALGQQEGDQPRMVHTPWFPQEIPLAQAAEVGTRKVICEHSTIGVVVTTDGSFTELAREDYARAEERIVRELQELRKPFCLLLNSAHPAAPETRALRGQLESRYGVTCLAANCQELTRGEIEELLYAVLREFPAREYQVALPPWVTLLPADDPLQAGLYQSIYEACGHIVRMRDAREQVERLCACQWVEQALLQESDLGDGTVRITVTVPQTLYYQMLSQRSGMEIRGESDLLPLLCGLARIRQEYEHVSAALEQVRRTGYGMVMPLREEMRLEQPEITRQGGRFGIRLKASAPSIHMIMTNVETEINPIVGSEKQSEELVNSLLEAFQDTPEKLWDSNIFGKSLGELVNEGLTAKLCKMPDGSRTRLQSTLERIINEGSGGLICIIL